MGGSAATALGFWWRNCSATERRNTARANAWGAIDHEILRVLQSVGLAEQVLQHTAPFRASEYFGVDGQLIKRIDMAPP